MSTTIEIALTLAGLFAIGWVILGPRGNIAIRLVVFALGIVALIAASILQRGDVK